MHLGWRRWQPLLDTPVLEAWLLERALEHDQERVLLELACQRLRQQQLVRPSVVELVEHLRPVLAAVQARQLVEFTYCKFCEDRPIRRLVGPLLLKEFRGRWYVPALLPESGDLRCFGLDRITDLSPRPRTFAPLAGFDAEAYYAQAFGIIRPDDEAPQEVILSLTPTQGRYVQTFPLRPSQRLLSQSETAMRIGLRVYDTHDLRMEPLSMGEEVEVLAPASLRTWVRGSLAAAQAGYAD